MKRYSGTINGAAYPKIKNKHLFQANLRRSKTKTEIGVYPLRSRMLGLRGNISYSSVRQIQLLKTVGKLKFNVTTLVSGEIDTKKEDGEEEI